MSELLKPSTPSAPVLVRIVEETRPEVLPFAVRSVMRESDFAGFTLEGRDVLARVLRRAIERNRKAVTP